LKLKYQLMWRERAKYPVLMMARLLELSRSGFYAWVKQGQPEGSPGPRARRRADLAKRIKDLWLESEGRHGARRLRAQLAGKGIEVSLWLVRKLMSQLGIEGVQPRASKRTTIPAADAKNRVDLLNRAFYPPVPGTYTVSDITYLKTGEGWLYLATVIDLTSRQVIGWQMADHMRTSLVADALKMAHQSGVLAGGAICHSDRGSQYCSADYTKLARQLDVRLSVGRTGSCLDNAVAESFFASLKNEMYHRRSFATRAKARLAVATYIEVYYNRQRPHSTLGYRTPTQAMADHFTYDQRLVREAA